MRRLDAGYNPKEHRLNAGKREASRTGFTTKAIACAC